MRTLFDTSVIVAALVDQLGSHRPAFNAFRQFTEGDHIGWCSTHALAECYATLTALPLAQRITPEQARLLIEDTVLGRLTVIALTAADYRAVLREVATLGLGSGAVYDALHVRCARKKRVDRILTYNVSDFERFDLGEMLLATP